MSLNSAPSSSLEPRCGEVSVSRHILRSPRVPASSAAATRARRETPCNITRHAPRDGTRLEDAHFSNLMHLPEGLAVPSLGASLSFTSRPGERRGRCVRTEREVIPLNCLMRQETEAAGKMVYKQSCDHHLLVHCPLSSLGASVWITSRPVRSSVHTHRGRARSSSTCF